MGLMHDLSEFKMAISGSISSIFFRKRISLFAVKLFYTIYQWKQIK